MTHQKTRSDLAIGFGSQLVYKALGYVVLALLARQLTQQDYGKLMFTLSLCTVAVLLTDLGASQNLMRMVAASPRGARRRTSEMLAARLPLMAVYLAAINAWVLLTKPELAPMTVAISLFAMCRDLHKSLASLLLGLRRITDTVISFGGHMLLLAAGVSLGVWWRQSLPWMVGCYVASGAMLLVISICLVRSRVGPLRLRCRPHIMRRVFGQSVYLFGLSVMTLVHFSADTLMLGYLQPYAEVARYEAAAKLLEASQFIVRPITMILFPLCTELAAACEWRRLQQLLRRMLVGTTVVGMAACAGVALLAGWIIRIVYTQAYDDSADVLRVLYLSVPGLYVATVGTFLAASMHSEKRALVALVSGVVMNVTLNMWAIPRWGALGAAWVTVASQTAIALWLAAEAIKTVSEHRQIDEQEGVDLEQAMEMQDV